MKSLLAQGYRRLRGAVRGRHLGRFRLVRRADSAIREALRGTRARVDGHDMVVDPGDALGLSIDGIYNPSQTRFVRTQVRSGDVVVDIGANIGYYTLLLARLVGPTGRVYAFEPDPTNYSLLIENVRRNGYDNVVAVPKAVSSSSGPTRLYLSRDGAATHRTYDSGQDWDSVEIDAIRLDDFLVASQEQIAFIKMDIEGWEPHALDGMRMTLQRNPQVRLLSEFYPFGLTRAGSDPREYLDALRTFGFKLFELGESGEMAAADPADLVIRYDPENEHAHTNVFCTR